MAARAGARCPVPGAPTISTHTHTQCHVFPTGNAGSTFKPNLTPGHFMAHPRELPHSLLSTSLHFSLPTFSTPSLPAHPSPQVLLDAGPRLGTCLDAANASFLCDKAARMFVPRLHEALFRLRRVSGVLEGRGWRGAAGAASRVCAGGTGRGPKGWYVATYRTGHLSLMSFFKLTQRTGGHARVVRLATYTSHYVIHMCAHAHAGLVPLSLATNTYTYTRLPPAFTS